MTRDLDAFVIDEAPEWEYLLERARWLVLLRWSAVVGIWIAATGAWLTGFSQRPAPLFVVGAALGLYNVYSWRRLRLGQPSTTVAGLRRPIFQQLLMDIATLAILLEFSGGAENPFVMIFAFPVAIGAMLLSRRQAVSLGAAAYVFQFAVVLGQFTGLLAHHGLHNAAAGTSRVVDPLYRSPRFLAGYLLAFAIMLAGVIYFVRSVYGRYRRAELLRREHERTAQSRERLARIGELSAGVAHAVRNPLHGLISSVDLLRNKVAGDGQSEETLSLMSEALRRIEQVTRRLLSLTRDVPLQLAPCDVDALIVDTLKLASPSAGRSRAGMETDLGGVGRVDLDAHGFAEALTNVIDNALQACRDGGTVTVRTFAAGGPEGPVTVEVQDSGTGIAEEHLARIFDPFFTTKAVGEGTGLGLAIARRVIEEHGGQVTVESAPARGTRFRMLLPRAQSKPGSRGRTR